MEESTEPSESAFGLVQDQHNLNQTRWTLNEFYEGGRNSQMRLDQLHNEANVNTQGNTDTTDLGLAKHILNRAGLGGRHFYEELSLHFAKALASIPHPARFVNPDLPVPVESEVESEVKDEKKEDVNGENAKSNTPETGPGGGWQQSIPDNSNPAS